MNMFQSTNAETPTEYIAELPEPRRQQIKFLHDFIRRTAPDLKPHIRMGMIGYGTYQCTYATGKEVEWFLIGLASRKDGISLYICAADGKQYLAEKYRKQLGKADIGKSCIRIKRVEDLDLKVLEKLIREAARWKPPAMPAKSSRSKPRGATARKQSGARKRIAVTAS